MASIKQKSLLKYKITVCAGYRSDGRKISKTKTITVPSEIRSNRIGQYVNSQAEALERQLQEGFSAEADTSFQQYAEHWLERQSRYAPSSLAGYRTHLQYTYPLIGHLPLRKIRPVTLEELCMKLRKRKYRGKPIREQTVQKYLNTVSVVLSDAKRNEVIQRNPARIIQLPKTFGKVQKIPEQAKVTRLHKILEQEPPIYRAYYLLAIYIGMRRGELCALTWGDVLDSEIVVSKSRTRVPDLGVVDGRTKNKKTRYLHCNEWMRRFLLRYIEEQYPGEVSQDQRLFSHRNGKPYHPDTFSKRLRKIYDTHGFSKEFHLHTLRHFFTSYQLQNNVSKQVVADMVGHGDTGYLERTYCHPQMEYKAQAARLITGLLNPSSPP